MSQPDKSVVRKKLIIVGDGFCGKTTLLEVFTTGHFPTHYVPTVFQNYVTDCRVDGTTVQLALWDTAGQEEYERLRRLTYPHTNVVLLGFAVDSSESFEHVKNKWADEITENCTNVPIILVGLKKDLREDPVAIEELQNKSQQFVSSRDASKMALEIGAKKYVECSSLTGEGVDDVFETATRAALLPVDRDASGCCVLL